MQPDSTSQSGSYRQIVERLRGEFLSPFADWGRNRASADASTPGPADDSRLIPSFSQMLDQLGDLRCAGPWLGGGERPDFAAPLGRRISPAGRSLGDVLPQLVASLTGLPVWNHPQSQINIAPCPTTASVLAAVLTLLCNPNLVSESNAGQLTTVEKAVSAMVADLVGFDPQQAGGVFTFGGAGGMLYGLKIGLEKAVPDSAARGLRQPAVVIASQNSHACVQDAAAWLGIGRDNVLLAPALDDHSASVPAMETLARRAIAAGRRVAAIVATMGSTDAFALDDLAAIVAMRDRLTAELQLDYRPHVHADAVIGWAWSMFNDYDFEGNPLAFGERTREALLATRARIRRLDQADTIGVDFHKTGYAPYISSLVLSRARADFDLLAGATESAPYLCDATGHHPGRFTLETSRSGAGPLAALASLLLLGRTGYRALLGHAVDMAVRLRDRVAQQPGMQTLNAACHGPVTLLRVYPDDVYPDGARSLSAEDIAAHNRFNRRVFERLQVRARGGHGAALSLTSLRRGQQGEPIVAIKSYVLSPFVEARHMDAIVDELRDARRGVDDGLG